MKYDRTVIAYHGCDAAVAERLLSGAPFRPSENDYDWLGSGIYFWEFGHDRALRFAHFQKVHGKVERPAVVGAVVQLGNCFDLMDTRFTSDLRRAYRAFSKSLPEGAPLPQCAFVEGKPVFPGSGIHRETHVQIAVRNPACVVGAFRPMMEKR